MVLHHHHQPQLDADAIPILQAGDELPLLYQVDHMHMLPRRKRHSGGEYSNNGNSSSTTANIANFVRRRGRSVPCDTRDGGIDNVDSISGGSSDRSGRNNNRDGVIPFVRTRAGSAAAALSSGRTRTGSLATALSERRRTASGVLRHFRRRKDDAPPLVFPPPSQQQRRANRRVHFRTTLHPEVMPNAFAGVASYDELLFNIGGLYQTLSFLHDPVPVDDGASSSTDSSSSQALGFDDDATLLPPERSMQLMIAEFLYRSAVYLGYPCDSKPWLPGFRETKRFSVNDVKRWRRLAHHDWEQEEQQFQNALPRQHSSSTGSSGANTGSSSSGGRLRAVVTGWLQRRRRHSAPAKMARAMNSPPPVPATTDVSLLVTIANSCVYCGAFQFSARDIRALCNVDIEFKGAPDGA